MGLSETCGRRVKWSIDSATSRMLVVVSVVLLTYCGLPRTARGDVPESPHLQHTADDVDGLYLMLGPLGAVSHLDRVLQSTFGGQVALVWVRERAQLATLGLAIGGLRYTAAERGRTWVELIGGTQVLGTHVGLAAGPVLEIDRVIPAKVGGQATVWLFGGVIPYIRLGGIADRGSFIELGLQIMLPARSW